MFRYLHAHAVPLIKDLATLMLTHGTFTLLPDSNTAAAAAPILAAADAAAGN